MLDGMIALDQVLIIAANVILILALKDAIRKPAVTAVHRQQDALQIPAMERFVQHHQILVLIQMAILSTARPH